MCTLPPSLNNTRLWIISSLADADLEARRLPDLPLLTQPIFDRGRIWVFGSHSGSVDTPVL